MTVIEKISRSAEETTRLGFRIGKLLAPGAVILLSGDLGSGKTCFARGMVTGLDIDDLLTFSSPSFTLMNLYVGRMPILHFDFYRLCGIDEIYDLGFMDQFDGRNVIVVEWPERILEDLPPGFLLIRFEFLDQVGPEARKITITDRDDCYQAISKEL